MTDFLAWLNKKLTGFWRWFKGLWRAAPETKRHPLHGQTMQAYLASCHDCGTSEAVLMVSLLTPRGSEAAVLCWDCLAREYNALVRRLTMDCYGNLHIVEPKALPMSGTSIGEIRRLYVEDWDAGHEPMVRHSPEWECNNRCLLDHPNEPHCNCDLCTRLGVCVPATERIGHDDKGQACRTG